MHVVHVDMALMLQHFVDRNRPLSRTDYRLTLDEVLAGRVLAGVLDGSPIVLGGVFVPDAGGPCTCWFSVVPGALGAPGRMLRAHRLIAGVLAHMAPAATDGLAAYVDDGNATGRRLAASLGFSPTGIALGGLRRWMWQTRSPAERLDGSTTSPPRRRPSSVSGWPMNAPASMPSRPDSGAC